MHHQHYSSRSYDQNDHHSQTTNSYAQSSTTRPQHPDRTMSRASNFHPPSTPSQQLPQPSEKLSVSTPPSSRGVRALESTLKKILNSPEKKTKR
ncbi:hypothetical protein C9374_004145 [Naegleria lovaniensis]|uniref:Uncharacterized protein n=1 Tax=Naegleria lovaniensis TaxID=51637 RepID=A0AA88GM26_NAELO|nr:uncharacterized protein C9374_004145 [Naegleria lovaniensis]KAG2383474.1 hypothetical protein C9374_004145 [Naegleria lovaniensis]